jgi:hypothetical protein
LQINIEFGTRRSLLNGNAGEKQALTHTVPVTARGGQADAIIADQAASIIVSSLVSSLPHAL